MSDLTPKGVPVTFYGVERHLLFTLNAVHEIQEHYDAPLGEVIDKLTDEKEAPETLRTILMILLNDEVEFLSYKGGKCDMEPVDERQVGWMITRGNIIGVVTAVLEAYGCTLPKPGEDNPNQKGGQQKK